MGTLVYPCIQSTYDNTMLHPLTKKKKKRKSPFIQHSTCQDKITIAYPESPLFSLSEKKIIIRHSLRTSTPASSSKA